ncbi:MAG: HEAT repeat domain-containing protein [Armatimonadota bacterium]
MSDTRQERDPRSTDEIIADALLQEDDDARWGLITALHFRGTRDVFEAARNLTESLNPDERCLGADILAQLGIPERSFPNEVRDVLLDLLKSEHDADVLQSACTAFGHNKDFHVVEPLARLKSHPSADVRYAVVFGLLGQEDEAAVQALIELSTDADDDVRNWATFGLGQQIDLDTPEIREALISRLDDEYDAVRGEALRGLACRDDERSIEPLIRELEAITEADEWWDYAFGAAENMPDSRLYPALIAAKNSGIDDRTLDHAIALCRIPAPEEGEDKLTDAPTSCPVCGRRRAFKKSDGWQFCKRCGWADDLDQRAVSDSREGYNRCSLNQERERWRHRLEMARKKQ